MPKNGSRLLSVSKGAGTANDLGKVEMRLSRVLALTFVVALLASSGSAFALDKVRAAKSVNTAWAFIPLDVGAAQGIWAKYGLEVEISGLGGDAKLQQALTSDSVDFGLGSGPSMAFAVKGSPVIAVAAFAEEPRNISVVIAPNSSIKNVADLKGKLISVITAGSLTDWLVHACRCRRAGARMACAPSRSAASSPRCRH
jgi:ABC-type nitrate/sulfonate/bicarbonate transport system substrate-binding protein